VLVIRGGAIGDFILTAAGAGGFPSLRQQFPNRTRTSSAGYPTHCGTGADGRVCGAAVQ